MAEAQGPVPATTISGQRRTDPLLSRPTVGRPEGGVSAADDLAAIRAHVLGINGG